jgi:hypothetical protein
MLTGVLLLTKGCTALLPDRTPPVPETIRTCARCLDRVDRMIVADGVGNSAALRIEGFPYLRTNRFWHAIEAQLLTRDQTQAWLEHMHRLDLEARRKEILNLPPTRLADWEDAAAHVRTREDLLQQLTHCAQTLFAHHRYETDLRYRVRRSTVIPDEYRTWRRLVGLYPLLSPPVALVTANVYDDFRQWHATPPDALPLQGRLVHWGPAPRHGAGNFKPQDLLARQRRDALDIPRLTADERQRLAAYFAPVIAQDEADTFDRIGTPIWQQGHVRVATDHPTVYYYFSYGLLMERPMLQINYVFWYPRREGPNAPWIERGPLDGLTVRISIDNRAQPYMLDLMNNCGCYHFFIPQRAAVKSIREIALAVDPLVPGWLPSDFPANRLLLRVNSGWHQVQHVGAAPASVVWREYRLAPYAELEMLPDEKGQPRSIFDADGIAHDSERIEPLIFFSMGIPAIGSMRQRGHHAIKLVGRAYFDDPLLFEQFFEFDRTYFELAPQTETVADQN